MFRVRARRSPGAEIVLKENLLVFFAPRKNLQRGAAFYKLEYLILNRSPASVALMTLAARDDAQRYVKATSLMPFLSDHDPVSDTAQAKFEE
jgi:hypothetical protein